MDTSSIVNENVVEDERDRAQGSASATAQAADEDSKVDIDTDLSLLLLEDSTIERIPQYAATFLNNFDRKQSSQSDLLMGLVYCIALECGFVTLNLPEQLEHKCPVFWGYTYHSKNLKELSPVFPSDLDIPYNDNIYKIDLKLLNLSSTKCLLTGIKSGDFLVLTLTPEGYPGRSICLSTPRYVLSIRNKDFSYRFRKLNELSQTLRERMFVPIRNRLLSEMDELYPGLDGIPSEILRDILRKLKSKDLQCVAGTCWSLRDECVAVFERYYSPKRPPFKR